MNQQSNKFICALKEDHKHNQSESFLSTIYGIDTIEGKNLKELFPHIFNTKKPDKFVEKSELLFHKKDELLIGKYKDFFWYINKEGGIGEIDCIGFNPLDILKSTNCVFLEDETLAVNYLTENHSQIANPYQHIRSFKEFCASYGYDFQYTSVPQNPLIKQAFFYELLAVTKGV